MITDGQRCGAAAIMENHALLVMIERLLNASDELIAKNTTTSKIWTILEVDDLDFRGFIGFNGEFVEFDDGIMLLAEVVIRNKRGGGTENRA